MFEKCFFFIMENIKYRIRKRKAGKEEQYYVDYKRFNEEENDEEPQWMGGFYAPTEERAKEIIEEHREMEELKKRLQMSEEVIYDETEEKK